MKRAKYATMARIHAKRRALERYGIELNRFDLAAMKQLIADQKARLLARQSNTRSIYLIPYKGKEYIAVYSSTTGTIHTFLTMPQFNETYGGSNVE